MELKFDYENELIDICIKDENGKVAIEIMTFEEWEEMYIDSNRAIANLWSYLKWDESKND